MSTIAKISNGSLFKIGDAASIEGFTTIPEVMKLSGPTVKFDLLDVTSHDSPSSFREWIPGLADGDMVSAQVNWRASNIIHKGIRIDNYARTLRNFKIVFPDTSDNTVAFSGYILEFPPTADIGTPLNAAARVKITGAPTWS